MRECWRCVGGLTYQHTTLLARPTHAQHVHHIAFVSCTAVSCANNRTVFVTGFPPDVKERELNNMLRFMPGYEASQMNYKNGQVRLGRRQSSCTR